MEQAFKRTKRYLMRASKDGPVLQSDNPTGPWEPCEPCDELHSEGIGELVERLMIANMKLWAVCDKKANAANMSQEDLRVLVADDLNLCKSRAAIRAEINRRLGTTSGETVKHYGETLREAAKGWEELIDKEGFPPIIPPGNATIRG